MGRSWGLIVSLVACALTRIEAIAIHGTTDSFPPGEGAITMRAGAQAEPHALEGAMNVSPDNSPTNGVPNSNVVNFPSSSAQNADNNLARIAENEAYMATIKAANEARSDDEKHKTLTDIWKKELPCECPFNIWKPVCGVDGNTYPSACFAECINVSIFVHADCKYVKRELWARVNAAMPTDYYEDCVEGPDDDEEEFRPKCRRRSDGGGPAPVPAPYPEGFSAPPTPMNLIQEAQPETIDAATTPTVVQERPLKPTQVKTHQAAQPVPEEDADGHIEWRVFNGMKVPYDTRDYPNPCPHCPTTYVPACGRDGLTYPSACFAICVGAQIARMGECETEH